MSLYDTSAHTRSFLCRFDGDGDEDWVEEFEVDHEDAATSLIKRIYNEDPWLGAYGDSQYTIEVKELNTDTIHKFVVWVDYNPSFHADRLIGVNND